MAIDTGHLKRSILTLEHSLNKLNKCEAGSIEYEVFRNATVKGFELSLEVSGKLMRKALKFYLASPKSVDSLVFKELFRYGGKHGILNVKEVERWLEYRNNRNDTAHDYGESFAEETLTLLPGFIEDVKRLVEKLETCED